MVIICDVEGTVCEPGKLMKVSVAESIAMVADACDASFMFIDEMTNIEMDIALEPLCAWSNLDFYSLPENGRCCYKENIPIGCWRVVWKDDSKPKTKREGIAHAINRLDKWGYTEAIYVGNDFGPNGDDRSVMGLIPCLEVEDPIKFQAWMMHYATKP